MGEETKEGDISNLNINVNLVSALDIELTKEEEENHSEPDHVGNEVEDKII